MSNLAKIRLGTRKSPLALAQAAEVTAKLKAAWPNLEVELVPMQTSGDHFTDRSLSDIGGKGLFTKEIEEALLNKTIDIAVHSMKDVPTVLPEGLVVGCMLERENPADMLVGNAITSLALLPDNATFGTSSLRRSAQLLIIKPDITILPLRGNVQSRLDKITSGAMTATMLAIAGLKRLGLNAVPGVPLPVEQFLPAVAQGAIGIECREANSEVLNMLQAIAHYETQQAVVCERAFLRALDGSCRTPIAGYAQIEGGCIRFRGLIIRPDGKAHHRIEAEGNAADALELGKRTGEALLAKAGRDFLN